VEVRAHLAVVRAAPAAGPVCSAVVLISMASRVRDVTWGKAGVQRSISARGGWMCSVCGSVCTSNKM
jgi:hypothetical protein